MEIREYFEIVKRHAVMVILLCVSTTITAAGLSYTIPDKYEAKALILVRPPENVDISSGPEDRELLRFPVTSGGTKTETTSSTYIEVIRGRAMTEKVVRKLRLDQEQDPPAETLYQKVVLYARKKFVDLVRIAKQIVKHG